MRIKRFGMTVCMAAAVLVLIATAFTEAATNQGEGQAIVTILPSKDLKAPANFLQQDLQLKVNGKTCSITGWVPLRESNRNLELVILIDDSIRDTLRQQFDAITLFIQNLPANVKVALGYMNSGRADLVGPLSTDHTQVADKLRIPRGFASNDGPYFCLSDLAKHWPSKDRLAERETVLITDGVDSPYGLLNPDDPHLTAAIADSVRAGLVVHSICWAGWSRRSRAIDEISDGGLMLNVTQATGGGYCCEGNGEPVSISPCLDQISWRLQNQYRLSFHSGLRDKPEIQRLELKVGNRAAKVFAPQQVFVAPPNGK